MPRPISATVSTSALAHNLEVVRRTLDAAAHPASGRPSSIWAVIKANAYGHGIERAVAAFGRAQGLAMLDLHEAIRCREAGWGGPILLLEGFFDGTDIDILDRYHLTTVIHCQDQLDMLGRSRLGRRLDAFIKLNTGMNRLGFAPEKFAAALAGAQDLAARGTLGQIGMMTHFACADGQIGVNGQMAEFDRHARGFDGPISLCNSAATLRYPKLTVSRHKNVNWVRPGICLYGASPFDDVSAASFGLRPVMTLKSELIGVQAIAAGQTLGYGATFMADHTLRIGVVACGYADGYPRHAGTGTPVVVAGAMTRVVGRISMDMLMVDLTPVPQADVGASVILWGEGGPSVDDVAQSAGTIGYELLCAVAPRVSMHTVD